MKSTKLECRDCKEYKSCKEKDGKWYCPLKIWMEVVNHLLGAV